MKSLITKRNCIQGAIIYALGDSCATLLTGEFQVSRLIGMMQLGGTLYAVEIPWYFAWIERHFERQGFEWVETGFDCAGFFNPLWIARHLAFIQCFS